MRCAPANWPQTQSPEYFMVLIGNPQRANSPEIIVPCTGDDCGSISSPATRCCSHGLHHG